MAEWKMYLWEGVLRDWSPGMVAIYARSLEEAIALRDKRWGANHQEISHENVQVCDGEPHLAYVYGGG